ncbi:MAG TPA: tRNA (N(6)-L-threonylcarbamoyladenosine(37)-C(2))-methylthiotransferase MtaB [Beijerinckiaceae bacterium]|jgi:threonylcarbamoyladenosine tRNA methylthiotransferase MtaB|nr:tRNA (N(6)-L-threonylcarbamoyladenosine(37)-C(2))-methylthiotransferase MtaB [Beijerinckiaceae bacterium]
MSIDVLTFGCRLNAYESQAMRRLVAEAGLKEAIIVNTCAVTAEAERQARQAIRKAARERPHARLIVTGCAAQIDPDGFAAMPEVSQVLGNAEKMRAESWRDLAVLPRASAENFGLSSAEKLRVSDIMAVTETANHLIDGFDGRARAFVQVQNGCDHRCTFCIIPYGRGNSRSVPMGEVVAQIRRVVDKGTAEVVLTGVDLTSYGKDLPGSPKLGTLVKAILRHVPELARLRLSSIDQVEADADLLDALAENERLMPHLHLSLQAGDDMILKRMKRRHSRADAIRFCEEARRLRPDVVFGADIIAGFPTETDEMFGRSLDIVDECGLTHLHVFPFSARSGTPAARMPPVPRAVVKERAGQLRARGEAAYREHLASEAREGRAGATRLTLMESATLGRTGQFTPVFCQTPRRAGEIAEIRVTGEDGRRLIAA